MILEVGLLNINQWKALEIGLLNINQWKILEIGLLNINQWKTLQRNERCLRNHISSRKYNFGDFIRKDDFGKRYFG